MNDDIVVVIPAYNPDEKFVKFAKELFESGYNKILVLNDGSREDTYQFFREAIKVSKCKVVSHKSNRGQGRAFKTALSYYLKNYQEDTIGVVECDCDGQHTVRDVDKCAELLRRNQDCFILGERQFDDKSIPLRSRFGNKMTALVFKVFCRIDIDDTQTGLKGIPKRYVSKFIDIEGERFEYASSVLIATKKNKIPIVKFPIETIYINDNETSHFRPVKDSIIIYGLIIRSLFKR